MVDVTDPRFGEGPERQDHVKFENGILSFKQSEEKTPHGNWFALKLVFGMLKGFAYPEGVGIPKIEGKGANYVVEYTRLY